MGTGTPCTPPFAGLMPSGILRSDKYSFQLNPKANKPLGKKKVVHFIAVTRWFHIQSIEFSGTILSAPPVPSPFRGVQVGGSIVFELGSTFSISSIFSLTPSQLMWNLVTLGFEAKIFRWS